MTYFVVPQDGLLKDHLDKKGFEYSRAAREEALRLKKKTGSQYNVVSVDLEWTTQTLGDLIRTGQI